MYNEKESLHAYKREAVRIARDFRYGKMVEGLIKNATSKDKVSIIMHNARCGVYDINRKEVM